MEVVEAEVNGSRKHSSLLWYDSNYGRKKFYGEGPGPNAIKNCRAFLQITLYFVTIGIKAQNNFTLQFMLHKMISISSHVQNKIYQAMKFWKVTLLIKKTHLAE